MTAMVNGTIGEVLGIIGVSIITVLLIVGLMAIILGTGRPRKIGVIFGGLGGLGIALTVYTNVSGIGTLFGIIDWNSVALLQALTHIGAGLGGAGIALGFFVFLMSMGR